MVWNYRIIESEVDKEKFYQVYEAYYEDGEFSHGIPSSWTAKSVDASGSLIEELKDDLIAMLGATTFPILRKVEIDDKEKLVEV